ncbi:MAG: GerMN domain-containing protein, partial [Butyricicoccaceae bacterium]
EDSEQPDQSFEAELYLPNENADGFDIVTAEFNETDVETPQLLIDLLIENGALPEGCTVNSFDMTKSIPPQLRLDLNSVYGEAVSRSGTAGEAMYLGSVVNTFLTYYDAEKIVFTVDGQPLETGHNVYDEPLGFFR